MILFTDHWQTATQINIVIFCFLATGTIHQHFSSISNPVDSTFAGCCLNRLWKHECRWTSGTPLNPRNQNPSVSHMTELEACGSSPTFDLEPSQRPFFVLWPWPASIRFRHHWLFSQMDIFGHGYYSPNRSRKGHIIAETFDLLEWPWSCGFSQWLWTKEVAWKCIENIILLISNL